MFQMSADAQQQRRRHRPPSPYSPSSSFVTTQMAIARYEASGLCGDYGFDEERQWWWATDPRGRKYRFAVEEIASIKNAA